MATRRSAAIGVILRRAGTGDEDRRVHLSRLAM
jgi:hypothetical protein